MIVNRPLTSGEKRLSRRFYNWFSVLNGFSYMCLGETVIILFAVRLNAEPWFIAILGSMVYFGFLMLPLGKWVAARIGGAQSQALFWVLRSLTALLVAASALTFYWGFPKFALGQILFGIFLFYGLRGAGLVMSTPLLGEISERSGRGKFIGWTNMLFYLSNILALTGIIFLMNRWDSTWMLSAIIVLGASLGIFASSFCRKISESNALRDAARQPFLPDVPKLLHNRTLVNQMIAVFMINLSCLMLIPNSMTALKKGYGVNDGDALFYSMIQFASAAVCSYGAGRLAERIGPRKVAIGCYFLLTGIAVLWLLAPNQINAPLCWMVFFLAGGMNSAMNTAMGHYFLQTIEQPQQVTAGICQAVLAGAGAGVVGMILGGLLLRIIGGFAENWEPLTLYRVYFSAVIPILLAGSLLIRRLVPVKELKEQKKA